MIDLDRLKQAVGDLDEDAVMDMLDEFIASKPDSVQTLEIVGVCQQAMEIVGDDYEKGKSFVGDLIFAGELLASCTRKLKPFLSTGEKTGHGVIVLGTVEGDIHDIGKNIFRNLAEASGFIVIDIGIDQDPNAFVEAVQKTGANIVGLSGVLSLSIDSMQRTVEALDRAGLRKGIKVAIGGNAVSDETCRLVGADAWSKNAAEAVRICREWAK